MTDLPELEALVEPLAGAFSGQVAVAFQSFETGQSYTYRATQTLRAASLIKLPILLCALTEIAKGNLSLEQRFLLEPKDQVGGSGVLWRLQPGLEPTLHDLLTLMIIVSDNTATNLLIDCLGAEAVNAYLQGLGLSQTKLVGKLQLSNPPANRESNATCAADVLGLLVQLERRDLLPDELTEVALDILKKQQFTEALARYLPTDPELSDDPATVASKSGCLRGLWHDAGVVYRNGTPWYALVVMTEDATDRSYGWEQEGMMLIAGLSKSVYEVQLRNL